MIEGRQFTSFRIITSQVDALCTIALQTCPRQVFELRRAMMLDSDNMLDVKRGNGCTLRQVAVLTARSGPAAH